ncbi:MAG TPA: DUF3311 domain-containing protein [Actinomycetales bacterium]|nr:DUF3311 domain-containing protein [Actinomycetales bacterium]
MTDPAGRRTGSPPPGLVAVVAVVLAVPVVALMWVSSYNKEEPRLGGVPFFYWYQFLWVFLAAACTTVAYRLLIGHERRRRALRDADGHRGPGGREDGR